MESGDRINHHGKSQLSQTRFEKARGAREWRFHDRPCWPHWDWGCWRWALPRRNRLRGDRGAGEVPKRRAAEGTTNSPGDAVRAVAKAEMAKDEMAKDEALKEEALRDVAPVVAAQVVRAGRGVAVGLAAVADLAVSGVVARVDQVVPVARATAAP